MCSSDLLFQFPSLEKGTNVPTERMDRELWLAMPELLPANAKPGVNPYIGKESDAVSRPTTPYVEMSFGMGKDGFPAISMTHYAATRYCRWLSAKTGHFYRLATEAEWEYAARGHDGRRFPWGDAPPTDCSVADWTPSGTALSCDGVGPSSARGRERGASPFGVLDLAGNVWEWTADWYAPGYPAEIGRAHV